MSGMIVEVNLYRKSVVPVPLHGCWMDEIYLVDIYNGFAIAFRYVF